MSNSLNNTDLVFSFVSFKTKTLKIIHRFLLILAFCGCIDIIYFSLELKWGATKCPMVCKVGEKCLSQWANGHNNFYFLLFFSTNHPKSPVTFNLITLSFLTTCKKSKSCNLWEGCCGNPVFPLSTLCCVKASWHQARRAEAGANLRHKKKSWGNEIN